MWWVGLIKQGIITLAGGDRASLEMHLDAVT